MPDLNMKYLRTFLTLVEERSTAKTAHRLRIGQKSVLTHVFKVEEVVGKPLLERRFPPSEAERGRTKLTEAGSAFLPKAMAALHSHDQIFGSSAADFAQPEIDRAIAAELLSLASAALKHDLSDEDCKRIYSVLC